MKNYFPLILIIILLFLPSEKFVANYIISHFSALDAEGTIAFYLEVPKATEIVVDADKVECKCNGTGKVRGPDGILIIPCPCLDANNKCDCKSKSKGTALPEVESEVKMPEKKVPTKQILMLTDSYCRNCVNFDNKNKKYLQDNGYGYNIATVDLGQSGEDDSVYDIIRVIKKDKTPKLFAKYNQEGWFEYIPQFVLIENGKVVKHIKGDWPKETVLGMLK